ncbi:hypothetical protein ACFU76_07370 [Streptomyces sp. NPDC057539]|uniref:hypothetical protein n=1 Tax=Streptomyces sp. NPDC057539 TaxID=3346159 RepID=UPI00367412E9
MGLDPTAARTPAEFVAMMRQLRSRADLSFRRLERLASEAGDTLPQTTIAGVLARQDLPREEVLIAFVRACGGDAAAIDAWLDTRRRLVMSLESVAPDGTGEERETSPALEPGPAGSTETPHPGRPIGVGTAGGEADTPADSALPDTQTPSPDAEGRTSRTRYLPVTLVGAFAAAGVLLLAFWPEGDTPVTQQPGDVARSPSASSSPTSSSQPVLAPGTYRMRTADGRCVTERRPPGEEGMAGTDDLFYQTSCTRSESTRIRLDEDEGGRCAASRARSASRSSSHGVQSSTAGRPVAPLPSTARPPPTPAVIKARLTLGDHVHDAVGHLHGGLLVNRVPCLG